MILIEYADFVLSFKDMVEKLIVEMSKNEYDIIQVARNQYLQIF